MTLVHTRLDIKTVSEKNVREHWAKQRARTRQQRGLTRMALHGPLRQARALLEDWDHPLVVLITRIAPSNGLDCDNLSRACSGVRDAIADALGLKSDRDPRVRWEYDQARSKPRVYAVEIRIETEAS